MSKNTKKYVVVVPHLTFHDVKTPLLKTFPPSKILDVVVIYEKYILDNDDYKELPKRVVEKISKYGDCTFALVLTGSYVACLLTYDLLRRLNKNVILLQYSQSKKVYEVIV